MLEHPNVARYWRAYEAFTKGDAGTIRQMLADDLVWHVPVRHRFSGDRNKAETMALFEEVVPEFSQTGEPVITTLQSRGGGNRRHRRVDIHSGSLEPLAGRRALRPARHGGLSDQPRGPDRRILGANAGYRRV